MKAITVCLSTTSTSSNRNFSLRARIASSTVLYCVLRSGKRGGEAVGKRSVGYCPLPLYANQLLPSVPEVEGRSGTQVGYHWELYMHHGGSIPPLPAPAHGEHRDRDAVELVEAAPGTGLRKALVDLAHRLVIHLVRAVEHVALDAQGTREILDGLSLAGAYEGVASLGEGNIEGRKHWGRKH